MFFVKKSMLINIKGEIGRDVTAISIAAQINTIPDGEDLVLIVDSNGGSVEVGFAIAETLKAFKGKKTAVAVKVASIANIIYLACENRIVNGDSLFLIHPVTGGGLNSFSMEDLVQMQVLMNEVTELILDYYQERTGTDKETIRPSFKLQSYFGAEEAMKLKFATEYSQSNIENNSLNTLNMSTFLENIKKVLKNEAAPDVEKMDEAAPAVSNEIPRDEYDADKARIAALEATVADLVAKFDAMSGMTEDSIANAIVNKYNASVAKSNIAAPAGATTANNGTSKTINNVW
jgi:ATP-dependent protease ClpP protease subunit